MGAATPMHSAEQRARALHALPCQPASQPAIYAQACAKPVQRLQNAARTWTGVGLVYLHRYAKLSTSLQKLT